MPKALDLTGQRFGKLVALKKVASKNKHTYWLCECDCGNQKEIQTSHLTNGSAKSCGCSGNKLSNANIEKECILCGKSFIANTYNRTYCYDCCPEGLAPADALRKKKRALKHLLLEYSSGCKCSKCGYDKCEGALHFHHLDSSQKDFSISHVNLNDTNFSIERMYSEIDKCVVLCANCHAEQHYTEE